MVLAHPDLFKIGALTVHVYGLAMAVAFVAGILWMLHMARRHGLLPPDRVADLALFVLLGGVIFARVIFVLLNLKFYRQEPDRLLEIGRGLSFHGGVLGGILGILLFCRLYRVSFLPLADAIAPALALGYSIVRIGCFFNGCCYGCPTDLPWAIRFPLDPSNLTNLTPPSHPTQIYDLLLNLGVFALLWYRSLRPRRPGQIMALWFVLYSITRIVTDYFRQGATAVYVWKPVTQAQLASAILIVAGLALFYYLGRRAPVPSQPAPELADKT